MENDTSASSTGQSDSTAMTSPSKGSHAVDPSKDGESPIRIALFTVMDFSIFTAVCKVIDQRNDVELAVVVTCAGPKSRRSNAYIEVVQALWDTGHYNTDVIISNKRSKYSEIMQLYKIDMILSFGYPWLLPVNILTPSEKYPGSPRLGAANFHNSFLPQYKGPNSFGWSICNGDSEFGFSSHRMNGEFDNGPILHSWAVPDDDINTSMEALMKKFGAVFPDAIHKTIDKMIAGDPGTPQTGEESFAPKFTDDFRWIDFSESTALQVHNKVRAFYGIRDIPNGALAIVNGETICITQTWYGPSEDCPNTKPGYLVEDSSNEQETELPQSFFVKCKDTTLKVVEWNYHDPKTT